MNNKIVFFGTPSIATEALKGILEAGGNVVAVVSQPPKPFGRKGEVRKSSVHEFADSKNIEVFTPSKIGEIEKELKEISPKLFITCAYGQFIPDAVLEIPEVTPVNIHASLLPKLRGGAPIHWAIINGEKKTGITLMQMVSKMDAGDMLHTKEIEIKQEDNVKTLFEKLSVLAKEMMVKNLDALLNDSFNKTKQNEEEVTFGFNIKPEDEVINFNKTSQEVFDQIRGLNPWPTGHAIINDTRVKISQSSIGLPFNATIGSIKIEDNNLYVKCAEGSIKILELQIEGKKKMNVTDFLNGNTLIKSGDIFNK